MNAIITLDSILDAAPALVATDVFGNGGAERIISAIETHVRGEVYDISTDEGRERVKSVAYKIARSKTTLDDIGKEHVAEIKAQSAAIDKERKALRDRLDALKEEVRGPLTAWEGAETARVDGHERALVSIVELKAPRPAADAASVRERIEATARLSARDWQEFKERADAAVTETLHALNEQLAAAKQHERDQTELAELRRLKAEREEADRKAEAARIAAEQETARKAFEERRERERAEKAEKDKAAAVAAAIEAERVRAEQEKAAAIELEHRRQFREAQEAAAKKYAEEAAERKRQENKRHRARIHTEIRNALARELIDAPIADRIIDAISSGDIPHVSINY